MNDFSIDFIPKTLIKKIQEIKDLINSVENFKYVEHIYPSENLLPYSGVEIKIDWNKKPRLLFIAASAQLYDVSAVSVKIDGGGCWMAKPYEKNYSHMMKATLEMIKEVLLVYQGSRQEIQERWDKEKI